MAGYQLVTGPIQEPITLGQAKQHLRVDIPDDDDLITGLIMAARDACEAFIHGYLVTQTWKVTFDAFPTGGEPISIPLEPLQSVTSVTYQDSLGNVTTMTAGTDYIVDTISEPGRLVLPPNMIWPGVTLWPVNPIVITATAGFGSDPRAVPQAYVRGMLLCVGHWYENRETVETTGAVGKEIPMSAEYLWWAGGRYWHL